jgi:hypothetical protein
MKSGVALYALGSLQASATKADSKGGSPAKVCIVRMNSVPLRDEHYVYDENQWKLLFVGMEALPLRRNVQHFHLFADRFFAGDYLMANLLRFAWLGDGLCP